MFIQVNNIIYINKTYRSFPIKNGENKLHTMYVTKSTKNNDGTYTKEYSVKLAWFGNMDFYPQQQIQITGIIGYEKEKYTDRMGQTQLCDNLTIEVMLMNNYAGYPQQNYGYQQGANYSPYQQQQPQQQNQGYQQPNNNYGSYKNVNDDEYCL